MRSQPGRLRLWSNFFAVLVVEEELEITGVVVYVCWSGLVLDVVGAVVVPVKSD